MGKRLYFYALVFLAGVTAIGVAGGCSGIFKDSPSENAKSAGVVETTDEVRIPLASLNSGKALFLKAGVNGNEIHYFTMRSSDGVYRAAYDTCDVCFRANRGYRQEGDLMVCNNCGQMFPSEKVNVLRGGCNPAPLVRTVKGEYLVIKKSDLAAGGPYFVNRRG
ncbi:MAG: DUF2318 domain-containing protein [Deltaproteobacteria bacterium]|nr:DUF2318 domain-containing protein [Deltaproteobacteria bacterium]